MKKKNIPVSMNDPWKSIEASIKDLKALSTELEVLLKTLEARKQNGPENKKEDNDAYSSSSSCILHTKQKVRIDDTHPSL